MKIAGYKVLHFKKLDSTQLYAREIARRFEGECAVVSDVQKAGFGRKGSPWSSESIANLYASFLLRRPANSDALAQLSLVAAASLHRALISINSKIEEIARIKWPNDLLCNGAKLAGLLVQVISNINQDPYIIIGVGVNVSVAPTLKDHPTVSLADCGVKADKMNVLEKFIIEFDKQFALWSAGGFKKIADYINRYLYTGDNIYNIAGKAAPSCAQFIDYSGYLTVKTNQGETYKIHNL